MGKRWAYRVTDWNPDDYPLGKVSDPAVAKMARVGRTVVRKERHARGIPAYVGGVPWVPDLWPLGFVKDPLLAETLGLSRPVVANARTRRGIPALTSKRRAELGHGLEAARIRWIVQTEETHGAPFALWCCEQWGFRALAEKVCVTCEEIGETWPFRADDRKNT